MPRGRHACIAKQVRAFCLISIEKNRSLAEFAEELVANDKALDQVTDLFGTTQEDRQKAQQYRWKRLQDRSEHPKNYVCTCIDHGVAISGEEKKLKAIEVEILRRQENKRQAALRLHENRNKMAGTRNQKRSEEEGYEEDTSLLKSLLQKEKEQAPATPTTTTPQRRKAAAPSSNNTLSLGGTATLMDRGRSSVPVDMTVSADCDNPWKAVLGGLFSLLPDVQKKTGETLYGMNAFEFSSTCADPRDSSKRSLRIVDEGWALLYTCETIPQYNLDDPASLATKTVEVAQMDGTATMEFAVRCQKAEAQYKALMHRLKGRNNLMKIKILLTDKVCDQHLNPSSEDGSLDLSYELVNHQFELDGEDFDLPVLKVFWQVALEDSIYVIDDESGVKQITKGMSKMKMAPKRPTPRK
jgi:hypothetical protein